MLHAGVLQGQDKHRSLYEAFSAMRDEDEGRPGRRARRRGGLPGGRAPRAGVQVGRP